MIDTELKFGVQIDVCPLDTLYNFERLFQPCYERPTKYLTFPGPCCLCFWIKVATVHQGFIVWHMWIQSAITLLPSNSFQHNDFRFKLAWTGFWQILFLNVCMQNVNFLFAKFISVVLSMTQFYSYTFTSISQHLRMIQGWNFVHK